MFPAPAYAHDEEACSDHHSHEQKQIPHSNGISFDRWLPVAKHEAAGIINLTLTKLAA